MNQDVSTTQVLTRSVPHGVLGRNGYAVARARIDPKRVNGARSTVYGRSGPDPGIWSRPISELDAKLASANVDLDLHLLTPFRGLLYRQEGSSLQRGRWIVFGSNRFDDPDWCERVTLPHHVLFSDTRRRSAIAALPASAAPHRTSSTGSAQSEAMIAPQYATLSRSRGCSTRWVARFAAGEMYLRKVRECGIAPRSG